MDFLVKIVNYINGFVFLVRDFILYWTVEMLQWINKTRAGRAKVRKILQLNSFVFELCYIILIKYSELLKAKLYIDNGSFQYLIRLGQELNNLPILLEEPYYYFCKNVFSLKQDYHIPDGHNQGAINIYGDDSYRLFHWVNVFDQSKEGFTYLALAGYIHNLYTIDSSLLPQWIEVGGSSAENHYIIIKSRNKERKLNFIEKFVSGDDFDVYVYGIYSREVFDDPSINWSSDLASNLV